MRDVSNGISTLIRFSRLAAEARTGAEILPLLADAAIRLVGAAGVVIVEVTAQGQVRVAASREVPDAVADWAGEADAISGDLGPELLRASGDRFAEAYTLPLVSTGGLFGALVLLLHAGGSPPDMALAAGLADLAAVAVGRASELSRLARVNADLRASREVLARTEKLRALGQMAAGMSHDLKNVLNPISLHAQLLQRAVAKNDLVTAKSSADELRAIVHRGVEMLERLRAFSRQSPEALPTRVDLNTLLHEAVAIARPRASARSGPLPRILEEPGEAPLVVARADEIVSALVNLVANAIDAMPDGGTIRLTTGASEGRAFVTVTDTGPGMSKEVQARVFEPFFTTKGAEGTGLGLAMVFATMERHGGSVSLETAEGKGAAFTLWFPTVTRP